MRGSKMQESRNKILKSFGHLIHFQDIPNGFKQKSLNLNDSG